MMRREMFRARRKPGARSPEPCLDLREETIMKVKELMTPDARAISLTETLSAAAQSMWQNDCGILPVTGDARKVVGLITDRDICMATAIRDRKPSEISVEEVMNVTVFSASPDDDINQALAIMGEHKIRRLPVVNEEGDLEGILSMNDIVLHAKKSNGKKPPIDYAAVIKTYQAICAHPVPMTQAATTATP
jgi:CBS-domain-containing membrane protein